MITLTTAAQINSVLGGSAPVGYNKLVLSPFTMNPVDQVVQSTVRLTSTANPDMQAIIGSMRISVPEAVLEIQVQQLDFYRRIRLTSPQSTSVLTIITNAQNALENGLITLGLVSGTQSAGS